jgi:hypothetical protein
MENKTIGKYEITIIKGGDDENPIFDVTCPLFQTTLTVTAEEMINEDQLLAHEEFEKTLSAKID